MGVALTDRPATQAGTGKPTTPPLIVDPVLDGPPRPADRPSLQPGLDSSYRRERVRARARRRRWAARAACAVPVLAAAVLAAPAQPRHVQAPASPRPAATARSASPAPHLGPRSPRPAVCSSLWISDPAGSPCLLSPAPAGRPNP